MLPVLLRWTETEAPPTAAPEAAASLTAAVKQVVSVSKHVHLSSCEQACNKVRSSIETVVCVP